MGCAEPGAGGEVGLRTRLIDGVEYEDDGKGTLVAIGEVSPNGRMKSVNVTDLTGLHETFQRYLYLPDLIGVDVAAASLVAHRAGGDPLWLQFVSPPSSGKTEILQSLTDCSEVCKLSSLTGQTFVSGFKGKNSSLLERLDAQGLTFLLLKDFTTVLSLHRDARSEILGALREIYDGEYSKGLRQRAVGVLVRASGVPGRRHASDRPAPPGPGRPRAALPQAAPSP